MRLKGIKENGVWVDHTTSNLPEEITDLTAELSPSDLANQTSLPIAKHSPRQNLPDHGVCEEELYTCFEHDLCFFIEIYVCPKYSFLCHSLSIYWRSLFHISVSHDHNRNL